MLTDIEKQAKFYEHQLYTHMTSNLDFNNAIDKLSQLEYQTGQFDHLSYIVNIHPDVPFVQDAINEANRYNKDFKDHLVQQEMSEKKAYIEKVTNHLIEYTKPNFDKLSIDNVYAYEIFLTKIKNNDLLNNKQLDVAIRETQIAIERKSNGQVISHINQLREKHKEQQLQLDKYKADKEKLKKSTKVQNLESFSKICGGIASVTSNKTIQKMAVIGQAGAQIGLAIDALSTISLLSSAAIDPVMGIAMAIFSVVSMFGNKKKENPNKPIMDALRTLSQQVYELHGRFDRIEDILGKTCELLVKNFAELRKDNVTMRKMMTTLREELKSSHVEIKNHINVLSNQLKVITNRQMVGERKNRIDKLFLSINKITSPYSIETLEFKEIMNFLKTDIVNLHPNNIFLVGENTTTVNIIKAFEDDSGNPFQADFNLMPFYRHVNGYKIQDDKVVNPMLWCWEALSFLMLFQRRYERSNEAEYFISKVEIGELKQVYNVGNEVRLFVESLRDISLFERLLLNYKNTYLKLKEALIRSAELGKTKMGNELSEKWRHTLEVSTANDIEQFKKEEIPIAINLFPEWFQLRWGNAHGNAIIDPSWQGDQLTIRNNHAMMNPHKDNFTTPQKNEINKFRANYVTKLLQDIEGPKPNEFAHRFIYPDFPGGILLPNLPRFKNIPLIMTMEVISLAFIRYSYKIENGQFIISIKLVTETENRLVNTLTIPYNPMRFTGNEAIWKFWVGGTFCSSANVSNTTCRNVLWDPQSHYYNLSIPTLTPHPGARDSIFYNPEGILQGATETGCSNETKAILEDKINEWTVAHKKDIALRLKDSIKQDDKDFIDYSFHFYMLSSWVDLVFRSHPQYTLLKYFQESGLRNRFDWLNFLYSYNGTEDFFDKLLEADFTKLTNLTDTIKNMLVNPINNDLLGLALKEFASAINWYNAHAVDENQLVTNKSMELLLKADNDMQRKLLHIVGSAIVSVTNPTQQKEIMTVIREKLKEQSIEISNNTLMFLPEN